MESRWISALQLIGLIVLCLSIGAAGGAATASRIPTWYAGLNKPSFNPPAWVFGPVWTSLYIAMAVAAWLVLRRGWHSEGVRLAIILFFVQLALNAAWSPVFFGMRSPVGGMVVIVALWLALAVTVGAFYRVSTPAGALMTVYLLWVSFATILNGAIVALNRGG